MILSDCKDEIMIDLAEKRNGINENRWPHVKHVVLLAEKVAPILSEVRKITYGLLPKYVTLTRL